MTAQRCRGTKYDYISMVRWHKTQSGGFCLQMEKQSSRNDDKEPETVDIHHLP